MAAVPDVRVEEHPDGTFRVEVRGGGHTTEHIVSVPEGLAARLGWSDETPSQLVVESFRFLLEREPATSILGRFRLDQIGDYFPDYAAEMGRRRA